MSTVPDTEVRPSSELTQSTLRRVVGSTWFMALCFALLAGVLINSGVQGQGALSHLGYTAGTGDQYVLSPDGIQLADPAQFANDFFLRSAPEPHWFFNLITAFGYSIGQLSAVYFLFWCVGLAFFGLATALLAKSWAPRFAWIAGAGFTVVLVLAPWAVVGTGSPLIAAAIPAVVGGFAAYLTCAALLTRRFPLAAVAAGLASLIHVQQGLVVAILLAATLGVTWVVCRKPDWWLMAGAVVSASLVAYGLLGNGFGGAVADFVRVCDEMIAYHCAAHLWSSKTVLMSWVTIALAVFSLRLVPKNRRLLWATTAGLVIAGLALGLAADVLRIPVLGTLAQGSNIYRLGAVLIFFTVWGMLSYLLRPVKNAVDAAGFVVWALLAWTYMSSGGWQFKGATGWAIYLLLLAAAVVAAFATRVRGIRTFRRLSADVAGPAMTAAVAVLLLVAATWGGFLALRPIDAQFIPNSDIREWGEAVEAEVPSGEVILHAPNAPYIKLATKRANIADCKNVPYGGEPYREWKQRLDDLGGWGQQCLPPYPPTPFNDLTAADLDLAAKKYGARFIVLEEAQADAQEGLERRGWTVRLTPVNALQNVLLERE